MFERQESLLECVSAVAKRYRATRFWWSIAIIATIASLTGYWLRGQVLEGVVPGSQAATVLLGLTATAAIVSFVCVRLSYRNPRWIATKIEHRFPGLQQRLLTALSQPRPADGQELGFLQRRVISDAYHHSVTHRWSEAVPKGAAILSRLSGAFSLLVFALVVALLMLSSPQQKATARGQLFTAPEITIEPGDAEVERASGLVISARFPSANTLPDQLDLVTLDDAGVEQKTGGEQKIAMSQSLADPILSAYVASIEKPFRYRVVAPNWQSKEYSVDVFEFPRLVRADASLDYPKYTAMDSKNIEDTVRLSAVEGTKIQWVLSLNKPVAHVAIRNTDGTKQEPTVIGDLGNQLQFDVTLSETQRWTIELTDNKGRKNKYPITLDARAIPNRLPELKIVRGGDIVASPLEEVSLAATAEDDFGLVRAGISYQMADGKPQDITLAESVSRGIKQSLDHLVELERLNAEPDQLLSYHFWAEDYSPGGEVRRTQSDLYFGEIRPFEEIFREGESPAGGESPPGQGASKETEELLELQKQIITATWKIARNPADAKQIKNFDADAQLLEESQGQAIAMAEEMASSAEDNDTKELLQTLTGHMQKAVVSLREAGARVTKQPLDAALVAEQAAYQTLLQLRAREFQVSRSRQQKGQSSGSASSKKRQQQLDELKLKNDENRYETQSQATDKNTDDAQREDRQVLNRLKELAQRQEDINEQLTQLQSALQQAEDEAAKEEVRRQLKRLREQEQELLREADELADRMQQPENSQSMSKQAEQLEETRENLRRSSEALEENNAAEALAAGTRAERQLDEMSEEFRKRAAGEFDETVREMRSKARELEQAQQQLGEQMEQLSNTNEPGLRSGGDREAIQQSLKEQQAALNELMEKVQQTVEEAEPAEPLLAQNLYETYRKTQQNQLEKRIQDTGELLRRGLDPQAEQLQQSAQAATSELRQDLEKAADSVLGNEEKALERALGELDRLEQALRSEMNNANGDSAEQPESPGSTPSSTESNDPQTATAGNPPSGNPPSGNPPSGNPPGEPQQREGQANERQPGESQEATPGQGRGGSSEGEPGDQPSGQGQPGQGQPQGQAREGEPSAAPGRARGNGGMLEQMGQGGGSLASPITGSGFREFSDGLRDVEEMVGDPALRQEAAAIRDRARQMRLELKRHSEQPQWSLVESMIARPLRELKMKVSEELLRRSSDRTEPVPIDRDPVPKEFSGAVKRYYESLGSGR